MIERFPKVSVVIPTFNRRDLIGETIGSVLGQTFGNLEILVIDDGSTDDTKRIVDSIGDPRIRYFYQDHSGKPAVPRNKGIKNARGEYIAFLDSDDLWLPDKLERQVGFLDKDPEIGLIYGQHLPFGNCIQKATPLPIPSSSTAKSGIIFKSLFLSWNFIPCLEAVVRHKIIEEVGGFDEEPALKAVEDFDLWLRIARIFRIQFIPEVMSKYRFHKDQIGSGQIEVHFFRNLNIAAKFKIKGWVNNNLFWRRIIRLYSSTIKVLLEEKRFGRIQVVSKAAYRVYKTCEFIKPDEFLEK